MATSDGQPVLGANVEASSAPFDGSLSKAHSADLATVAATIPSTHCYFLELPQEMRDEIYVYAFTTDHDDEEELDLLRDGPPSKSLCLTNKQIHQESKNIYDKAYAAFWTENNFYCHPVTPAEYLAFWSLQDTGINQIKNLSIVTTEVWHNRAIEDRPEPNTIITRPRSAGASWTRKLTFHSGVQYGEFVIGAQSSGEMHYGWPAGVAILTFLNTTPDSIDHGSGLAEWEAETRQLNSLGPAPSMLEQLRFLAENHMTSEEWAKTEGWWKSPIVIRERSD